MAGETVITVVGNLTADPELKFLNNGDAVANFSIASTPRTYNRQSGEWEDGEAMFLRCNAWRQLAENISESFSRGTRVIAQGRLKQRSWEDRDSGQKRTVIELEVDEIGGSVRFATSTVHRADRQGSGGGGQQQRQGGGQRRQGGGQGGGGWSGGGGQGNQGNVEGHGWGRTGGGGRSGGGGGGWGSGGQQQRQGGGGVDPWASAPSSGGNGGYDDEPPF